MTIDGSISWSRSGFGRSAGSCACLAAGPGRSAGPTSSLPCWGPNSDKEKREGRRETGGQKGRNRGQKWENGNNEHLSTAITVTVRWFREAVETGETREQSDGLPFLPFLLPLDIEAV